MGKVRCNNCEKEFDEKKIVYDSDTDAYYCTYCGESGWLIDAEDEEYMQTLLNEKKYSENI